MASHPFRGHFIRQVKSALARRFSLHDDQSDFETIDRTLREGVEMKGTNLWVLMLAIFIASIGLNVNSTAVIIGAMLVSPLMGPIMGVGYGVGINDYQLIEKALGNLLVAVFIALLTSTLYFLVSPLSAAQSELLARTTPSIWDVLIALFGGLAGMIAVTRKEKTNILPGVAIATALMPPLCTAGYGIANGSLEIFLGAFYLFCINGVFIAFATLILVGYLQPPHKRFVNPQVERKVKFYTYGVVLCTILPSIYLAYGLVTHEVFQARVKDFIRNEVVFENSFIAKQKILPDEQLIDLTVVGQKISATQLDQLAKKLASYHLAQAHLVVHQTVVKELDEASLKQSLLTDVLSSNQAVFDTKNQQIQALEKQVAQLTAQQSQQAELLQTQKIWLSEFAVLFPQVRQLAIAKTLIYQTDAATATPVLLVTVTANKAFSKEEQRRSMAWFKVKTGVDEVKLTVEVHRNLP